MSHFDSRNKIKKFTKNDISGSLSKKENYKWEFNKIIQNTRF